jgi:Domain of unknown function (DUF4132)
MGRARNRDQAEPPAIHTAVTHTIDLAPEAWAWATWRPRSATLPEAPPAPAFKLPPAVGRLSRLLVGTGSGEWLWGTLTFKLPLAREAAHFWLTAVTAPVEGTTPADLAEQLSKQTFDGVIDLPALAVRIPLAGTWWSDRVDTLWQLLRALSPGEVMGLLLDARVLDMEEMRETALKWLIEEGGRLTQSDVDRLKPIARERLAGRVWPDSNDPRPPLIFYVAARLGLHEELLALVSSWPDNRYSAGWSLQKHSLIVFGLGSAALVESQARRLKLYLHEPYHVRAWLAHTEFSALDVVRDSILRMSGSPLERLVEVLMLVKAPETALPLLELRLAGKGASLVRNWFEEQVGNAIAGLIPVAAGRGKLADAAIEYLREARRKGHTAIIEQQVSQAAAAGPEIAERVRRAVLEHTEKEYSPLSDTTPPDWLRTALEAGETADHAVKLPPWAQPSRMPPVVVGECCLSETQINRLLLSLKASQLGAPGPVLAVVKERVDRASLEAFAWRLHDLWQEVKAPTKEQWALAALGHFGGDATALKLGPMLRAWADDAQGSKVTWRKLARAGLECLCAIGTDAALVVLNGLGEKIKHSGVREAARSLLKKVAQAAGLSQDELQDRIVPDLGLDEKGSRVLDFGPRRFRALLGPDLKPLVRDEEGKVRGDLPKPTKKDDEEKAQEAVTAWKLLKKQLRETARLQALRLERAMVEGRRWRVAEFERLLVRHPLMTNLVRLLVWGMYDEAGDLKKTFRVTEDREYTDASDNPVSLEGATSVGIVHPLQLDETERAAWGDLLADYEVTPPFPQLARPVYRLEPEETCSNEITRFQGRKVAGVWIVGILKSPEWERGGAGYDYSASHARFFPAARLTAVIEYGPGLPPGNPRDAPEQTLGTCYFVPSEHRDTWVSKSQAMTLEGVEPVVISETLLDFSALAAKGTG